MVACGTPPRSSIPPAKTGGQICMVVLEATPDRSHSHGSQVSQREQVDIDPFPPHFLTAASIRSGQCKKSKSLPEFNWLRFGRSSYSIKGCVFGLYSLFCNWHCFGSAATGDHSVFVSPAPDGIL
jgi:hypothetical protein